MSPTADVHKLSEYAGIFCAESHTVQNDDDDGGGGGGGSAGGREGGDMQRAKAVIVF